MVKKGPSINKLHQHHPSPQQQGENISQDSRQRKEEDAEYVVDRTAIITVESLENMRSFKPGTSMWVRSEFAGEQVAQGSMGYVDDRGHASTFCESVLRWSSNNSEAIDSLLAHPILFTVFRVEGLTEHPSTSTTRGTENTEEEMDDDMRANGSMNGPPDSVADKTGRRTKTSTPRSNDRTSRPNLTHKQQASRPGKGRMSKGRLMKGNLSPPPQLQGIICGRSTFDLLPLLLGETDLEEELSLEAERRGLLTPEQPAWPDLPRVRVRARLHRLERLEMMLGPLSAANSPPAGGGSATNSIGGGSIGGGHKRGTVGTVKAGGGGGVDAASTSSGRSMASNASPRRGSLKKNPSLEKAVAQEVQTHEGTRERISLTRPDPWADDEDNSNGDIRDGNILFITVEALYAPPRIPGQPEDILPTQQYTTSTTVPIGREVYNPVLFEGGVTMDGPDPERASRWSTLHYLGTRASLTKYRMSDEMSEVKCTIKDSTGSFLGPTATTAAASVFTPAFGPAIGTAAVEQAVDQSVNTLLHHQGRRVQWNSLRRCYITDVTCNSIYALVAKYHLWPFEVTYAPPPLASLNENRVAGTFGEAPQPSPAIHTAYGVQSRLAPGVYIGPLVSMGSATAITTHHPRMSSARSMKHQSRHGKLSSADNINTTAGNLGTAQSSASSRHGSRARQSDLQKKHQQHWVAYVDLCNLLYPGVTRTRVAAPLMHYDPAEMERLCGPRGMGTSSTRVSSPHAGASFTHTPTGAAAGAPNTPSSAHDRGTGSAAAPGLLDDILGLTRSTTGVGGGGGGSASGGGRATVGSRQGRTPSGERIRLSPLVEGVSSQMSEMGVGSGAGGKEGAAPTPGQQLLDMEGANGDPTLIIELQLMRPLVPKRSIAELDTGIQSEVPTRSVLPKSIVAAMEAENDYRNAIEELAEIVTQQLREFENVRTQMESGPEVTHGGGGCNKPGGGRMVVDRDENITKPPSLRNTAKGPAATKLAMLKCKNTPQNELDEAEAAAQAEMAREQIQQPLTTGQRTREDERVREATRRMRALGAGPVPMHDLHKWFKDSGMEELTRQAQEDKEAGGDPCCTQPSYVTCDEDMPFDNFVEFMRTRGVYTLLRERIRGPLTAVVREKFASHLHQDQPLVFKRVVNSREEAVSRVRTQNFLSDMYVFLVEEAHSVVNAMMDLGDRVPPPVYSTKLASPQNRSNGANKSKGFEWTGGEGPRGERRRRALFVEEALEDDNPNRAAQLLLKPVRESPLDPDAWLYYGVLLLRLRERARATECVREALALGPRHRIALMMYGVLLCESGRHQGAELYFDACTTFHPQFVEAWVVLHLYYVKMERTAAAEVVNSLARRCYESTLQHAEWFWRERARPLAWRPRHASNVMPGTLTPPATPTPASLEPFSIYMAMAATRPSGHGTLLMSRSEDVSASTNTPGPQSQSMPAPPPSRASLDERVAVLMPLPESVANAATSRPLNRFTAALQAAEATAHAAHPPPASGGASPSIARAHGSQSAAPQRTSVTQDARRSHTSMTRGESLGNQQSATRQQHSSTEGIRMESPEEPASNPSRGTMETLTSVFLITAPMLIALGLYDYAELALARELETQGPSEHYFYYLAALHYAKGQYINGIQHIEKAIGENPKEPTLWALLGHCRARCGEKRAAERAFELVHETKATDTSPEDAHLARIRLGALWTAEERYDAARNILSEAVNAMPTPLGWRWLGVASFKLRNLKDAEQAFYEANLMDNTCPITWGYLSLICLIRGEERKYQQCYRMALKHNLNDVLLLNEIKLMHKLQNFSSIEGIMTDDPSDLEDEGKENANYVEEVLSKAKVRTHRKKSSLEFIEKIK